MRILFLSRTLPHRSLGATETRLNDRLCELSELGHDVLVLTKWTGESLDFDFPARIEIRSPFKTFRAWEWPKALPMIFAWRPDLLHIHDPGLSVLDRTLSVELMALTMLETLKLASRGRSSYRGGLVSLGTSENVDSSHWKKAGAHFVENEWLRAGPRDRANHLDGRWAARPWDQALDRPLRLILAGRIGVDISIDLVIDALHRMRDLESFELSVFLERARLTTSEKRRLAQAERAISRVDSGAGAVGARLKLILPTLEDETSAVNFDAGLLLGLKPSEARRWLERFPIPVVLSESLTSLAKNIDTRGPVSHIIKPYVAEVAPMAQALALATDRNLLRKAWSGIEAGALIGSRDVAANHVSRLYSQIARIASPS